MDAIERAQLFIGSPSDLTAEREIVRQVCQELSQTVGAVRGVFVNAVGWENCLPGIGSDPQAVINSQVSPSDIFCGIFWKRLGTPTPRAETGTVEELQRAIDYWGNNRSSNILLYFKEEPYFPKTVVEAKNQTKLLAFRDRLAAKGILYRTFVSTLEFEREFRKNLTTIILRGPVSTKQNGVFIGNASRTTENHVDLKGLLHQVERFPMLSPRQNHEWISLAYIDIGQVPPLTSSSSGPRRPGRPACRWSRPGESP